MDEVVTDSSARTTIWNPSKSKSQEVRGSDNSQLNIRDQENLLEEDDDVPIQEGEFRARKKNKILNYHSLRRIRRRRSTLERKPSLKKSTRNDRTKEMFDLGELLSSQNNSQFIMMGISCNPDCDTISHEAYGTYAADTMNSTVGQELLQQFISGWALVKSTFPSGVTKPTKVLENGATNTGSTMTQVVNGALAVVSKTLSRFKKPVESTHPRTTKTVSPVEEREVDTSVRDLEEGSSTLIRNRMLLERTETPISTGFFESDVEIDMSDIEDAQITSNQMNLSGMETPLSPANESDQESLISNSVDVSYPAKKNQVRSASTLKDSLDQTAEAYNLSDNQVTQIAVTSANNVPARRREKRKVASKRKVVQFQNDSPSNSTSVEPEELGLPADATAIIINNEVHQIESCSSITQPVTSQVLKRKATRTRTVTSAVKRKTTATRSQRAVYICPKCNVNYAKDKGGKEWVQCSKSSKCPVWGHVDCMGDNFSCNRCKVLE